jgi:hypothetical protein
MAPSSDVSGASKMSMVSLAPLHGLRTRRIAADKRAAAGVVGAAVLPAEAWAAP